MDNISIKRNIKRLRNNAGLTLKDMAVAMDISITAYKNIENNNTRIVFDKLGVLAATLHVTPEEVLLGYPPVSPDSLMMRNERDREAYIHGLCEEHSKEVASLKKEIEEKDRIIRDLREYLDARKRLEEIASKKL